MIRKYLSASFNDLRPGPHILGPLLLHSSSRGGKKSFYSSWQSEGLFQQRQAASEHLAHFIMVTLEGGRLNGTCRLFQCGRCIPCLHVREYAPYKLLQPLRVGKPQRWQWAEGTECNCKPQGTKDDRTISIMHLGPLKNWARDALCILSRSSGRVGGKGEGIVSQLPSYTDVLHISRGEAQ